MPWGSIRDACQAKAGPTILGVRAGGALNLVLVSDRCSVCWPPDLRAVRWRVPLGFLVAMALEGLVGGRVQVRCARTGAWDVDLVSDRCRRAGLLSCFR